MIPIGVLVRLRPGVPEPPERSAHGRAALSLRREGIDVVFGEEARGGRLSGFVARPGGWREGRDVPVAAAYDRFPFQRYAARHRELRAALEGVPIANPEPLLRLCRDKLETQRYLEPRGVPMPPIEEESARFAERLEDWGAAFVKPRLGSFGRGVAHVAPGDALPPIPEADEDGARFLQRAVPPPPGLRSACLRMLAQREPGGAWALPPPVWRTSREDPVATAERGAEVLAADRHLAPDALEAAFAAARRVCEALSARDPDAPVLELGIDVAVDRQGRPWVLEVNAQPRGRLEVLAALAPERYREAHLEACRRPLRWLAARFGDRQAPWGR